MTKKLTDKEKGKRSYLREWRKADPEGLGPYNIVWEGKTNLREEVRGVTDPDSKVREIIISKAGAKDQPKTEEQVEVRASSTLAHEIAHSRLLKSEHLSDEDYYDLTERHSKVRPTVTLDPHGKWVSITHKDTPSDQVAVWEEMDAVFHQVAKGWDYERWLLIGQLHDAATYFGNGSLKDAKIVAKKVLEHQVQRGHITREELRKGMQEIDAVKVDEWKQWGGPHSDRFSEGTIGGVYSKRYLIEGGE